MQLNPKRDVILVVTIWTVCILASFSWNIFQLKESADSEHVNTARAFVQQILISRAWNAAHGGVYLCISETLQPNPYLDVPNRDVKTTNDQQLTLINPAFMTRMISEIADKEGQIQFHLTSLNPINPGNEATLWEKASLQDFEKNQSKERFESFSENHTEVFHYMKPLITKKSCLKCHANQGYKEGDIRGGISVSFPVQKKQTNFLVISHFFILFIGILAIGSFGLRIVRLTDALEKQSNIDGLTQIANRGYFDDILHKEWLRRQRMKSSLSLIMCDIDHFKLYNDTYGHQAGDKSIQMVAKALAKTVNRPADMVARYGGEEFVVVLPETDQTGALAIADLMQKMIENLQIPHSSSKTADFLTISLGVATMTTQRSTEKELIEAADKALYASKNNGRNMFTHANDI